MCNENQNQQSGGPTGIPVMEGYSLVEAGVRKYWSKFFSMRDMFDGIEDLTQELFTKFLRVGLFDKYDPAKCPSKGGLVDKCVYRSMIDLLKKQHPETKTGQRAIVMFSDIPVPGGDGLTFTQQIIDETVPSVEEQVIGIVERERLLAKLPDTTDSKLQGVSPRDGEVTFNLRMLASHLEEGYRIKDIAEFFPNKNSGKPVSSARVSQLLKQVKDMLQEDKDAKYE